MTDRTPAPDRLLLTRTVRENLFAHARAGASGGGDERVGRDDDSTESDGYADRLEAGDEESARPEDATAEVCGVLGGRTDAGTVDEADVGAVDDGGKADGNGETVARVTAIRRVPNVAADARFRYELDPAATVEVIDALEAEGLTHVGFYHSHPNGPRGPSRTDEASAIWPGYVYLIVSLTADPAIGAWRWTGEAFAQLPIEVE